MTHIINFIRTNLPFFIFTLSGVVIVFIIIFIVARTNRKDRREQGNILANLTTPRIFILNSSENLVTYFDRGQHEHRKTGSLNQFYHQFTAKSVEELEAWVNALMEPKSGVELFYKVDVFVKSLRRSYPSLLEVVLIDYEKKIIHLESYLYRYLKPNDQMNLVVKKRENIGYASAGALANMYRRYAKRGRGVYGAVNLSFINPNPVSDKKIPPHILYELYNQVSFYRGRRRIIRFNEDEATIGIYFARANDTSVPQSFFERITNRMRAYLEINGHDEYSLAVGLARAREFNSQKMCFKTAEELSHFAHREQSRVYIYDPSNEIKDLDLSLFRNEVHQIISRKSVDTYFQPIIDTHNVEILGYLASFNLSGTLFSAFDELQRFARENKGSTALVKMILRKSAANYYTLRRNSKHILFMPLEVADIPILKDILTVQPFSESNLRFSFMIEEEDITNSFTNNEEMKEAIMKIKELGYLVTLVITDTELTLPDTIYSDVDYFMVNDKILGYTQGDERERLYLLSTLGKLLRHKKPIMITELSKWSEIEYYIRAGVDYVASDEISKKETNLQTIDKKKALRIIQFNKRRK